MLRPASAKMRSSTRGTVRMVGPMSKRKPPSCSTAALPPTQPFLSNSDRAMTARGEHAGGGKAAEPAADHRNRFGLRHTRPHRTGTTTVVVGSDTPIMAPCRLGTPSRPTSFEKPYGSLGRKNVLSSWPLPLTSW